MVFTSPTFLFLFLPLFLVVYHLLPHAARNLFIFAASLLFIFSSSGVLTLILLFVIVSSFVFALLIERMEGRARFWMLAAAVTVNLVPLLVYKYLDFGISAVNQTAALFGSQTSFALYQIALPVGISFYTFHALSYLWDVNKKLVSPSRSFIDFGMYMTNFPQLIAGPIVRYAEIADRIRQRPVPLDTMYSGVLTFCFGLAKKSMLADPCGALADQIYALPPGELTTSLAWLAAFAYSLQIYYDFSGYSDMAIGLGRMMGFEFPQNFDQPYRSRSITEFWRRWHMTLSRWFRDYVYIPLGGNRVGAPRTFSNLVLVFFLVGLWHGAAYQFIVWGLYHGTLLMVERILKLRFDVVPRGPLAQAIAFLLVLIGWVLFRAPTLHDAGRFYAAMFGLSDNVPGIFTLAYFLTNDKIAILILGAIIAVFPFERFRWFSDNAMPWFWTRGAAAVIALVYAASLIAANGFNPFIYFRF